MFDGGSLWIIIDVAAVVLLGGALVYGTMSWRRRRAGQVPDRVGEQATRNLYQNRERQGDT